MSIAFFDLDRTIIARNSGTLWLKSELRLGYVGRLRAARAATWLLRYHLGLGDLGDALRDAIAGLRDTDEASLRRRTEAFYRREVRHLVRPGAHAALDAARAGGQRCVLLTTSSNYLSAPVARDLALDDYLCTTFEVDDRGVFTGEPNLPLCYGAGKVTLAQAYAAERGVALADCSFYSDSLSDQPMLEAVGRPVVVNPDPRLLRVARARGWPIEDWGEPPLRGRS